MGVLDGKVAVILGASSGTGIGPEVARTFARDGATCVVAARRKAGCDELAAEIGGTSVACDISKEGDVAALAKAALEAHGKIDIAVNCAGVAATAPIAELDEAKLESLTKIHFYGTAYFIKHMAAAMKDGGSIITTSTLTAYHAGPGLGVYSASKAAADQLVRVAAVEYGPANIKVNSFSPGLVLTPMNEALKQMPPVTNAFVRETPLGRLAEQQDIANGVLWLASDLSFTTGQNIQLNGGASLGRLPKPEDMT